MKSFKSKLLTSKPAVMFAVVALSLLWAGLSKLYNNEEKHRVSATQKTLNGFPSLPDFTYKLMNDCKGSSDISEAKKRILVGQIVRAAETHLQGLGQYAFVANLCLETRVGKLSKPKSGAGAIGISQLMPTTAQNESKRCGYGELKLPDDLYDNELNLLIAACHFRSLVDTYGIEIAPLAYNAGGNSDSVNKAKALMPPAVLETAGYSAIHGIILTRYLLEPISDQLVPAKKYDAKPKINKESETTLTEK